MPVIAPCNGFQIAVQMGLLPGPDVGASRGLTSAPAPTVALAPNDTGRFVDRWCGVEVPGDTLCVWTRGLDLGDEAMVLPIAHGEGRFTAAADLRQRLAATGRVAMRYRAGDNPNGSADHIAGICDASGLVLGLMPHPERFTRWTQHPRWTRLDRGLLAGTPLGVAMFHNAVARAGRQVTAV